VTLPLSLSSAIDFAVKVQPQVKLFQKRGVWCIVFVANYGEEEEIRIGGSNED
jgi:hypothetical protein